MLGVGRSRLGALADFNSPVELDLLRTMKRALDPGNILNHGQVVPV